MVRYAHSHPAMLIALLAVASFLQAQTATETPPAPLTKAQIKEQLTLKQVQIRELQRQIDELSKQQAQDTSQTTTPTTPSRVATVPVQVTPAPMFEPKTLTVSEPSAPTPAAVQQIGLGQTPSEVHAFIGMPTIKLDTLYTAEQWAISHVEQWTISPHDAVSVRFDDGKVAWIGHFDPNPWQHNKGDSASPALSPSKGPSKWERFSDGHG
jgi:hypothetical protein